MVTSVYYEDMVVGQSARMERTVSEADISAFAEATGDFNPVHFDEAYARETLFRGRVAHGVLSVGFMSAVIGTQLPGAGTIFISANVEFKAPVRIGDTVITTCTIKELQERRRVVLDCICTVRGETVVKGEALVLAPRRPKS
jgi:3-hydroxybutyryl-CoA dehydratase